MQKNNVFNKFYFYRTPQVEIYYWRGTMPVPPSNLWYWHSTGYTPNDNSAGSWQSVLGWYLKAVLVQYYQPVLITVISTAPVVNQ